MAEPFKKDYDSQRLIDLSAWILMKVGMQPPLYTFLAVDSRPFGREDQMGFTKAGTQ
jgi:hypothetical protein